MDIRTNQQTQELVIKGRSSLTLNCVNGIKEFSESLLVLYTQYGVIFIEGNDMRIESLSKESGVVSVSGRINGFYYKETKESKTILAGLAR